MRALQNTATLLKAARPQKVPVASCYTACKSDRDMPYWKIKAVVEEFRYGHPCTQLDDRIYDPAYDFVLEHNMYAVQTLCDEIYVMADGRVLTHGEHGAVFQEPRVLEAYLGKDYAAPS